MTTSWIFGNCRSFLHQQPTVSVHQGTSINASQSNVSSAQGRLEVMTVVAQSFHFRSFCSDSSTSWRRRRSKFGTVHESLAPGTVELISLVSSSILLTSCNINSNSVRALPTVEEAVNRTTMVSIPSNALKACIKGPLRVNNSKRLRDKDGEK